MFSSSLEIARSHIRLPVNRDLSALKQALRDWLRYTEQTPLQKKQSYPAALRIEVRRPQPPLSNAKLSKRIAENPFRRGLAAWRRKSRDLPFTSEINAILRGNKQLNNAESEKCSHVFVKHVPLELWTALLPWEVQRGLSGSILEETSISPNEGSAAVETNTNNNKEEEENEDPYGIVSSPAGKARADAYKQLENDSGGTKSAVRQGLLFVLDAKQTKQQGTVRFWSGGIINPIDVLFFVATQPPAVSRSPSFRGLRREDVALKLKNNELVHAVAEHFFPNDELGSSLTEFRLHTHGHLDPFPPNHTHRDDSVENNDTRFNIEASFPSSAAPDQIPRFVLEAPRYFLLRSIQRALSESGNEYERRHGPPADVDVDLQITLELSEALKGDLLAKAQLHAQYVMPLEGTIAHHTRRLNTPRNSDADRVPMAGGENGEGGAEARVQVWLSEKEQRWMTPREIAALQAQRTRKFRETPWEAQRQDGAADEEAAITDEEDDDDPAQSFPEAAAGGAVAEERTGSGSDLETSAGGSSIITAKMKATMGDSPPIVQPARPGATSMSRSIGRFSPTLAEEDDGRPSYLAPSFYGRNDSTALHPHALVVNADKLARYPRIRSHLPQLPPIDYELLDLCVRLGVGQGVVLYYYYERLMREWRQELRWLRNQPKKKGMGCDENTVPSTRLHDDDVQRMEMLVQDSSLQVPDEFRSLVEAVHEHRRREELH